MSGVWAWLAKARNRTILAFLGAGLAAVAAGGWQVYLHLTPSPAAPQPTIVVQSLTAPPPPPGVAPLDTNAVKGLAASQRRALQAETNALDDITRQIDAAGSPSAPNAKPGP